jgi:4'-phosphopantetheinyl transferase
VNEGIQIWRASLAIDEATELRLRGILSDDERERADGFQFDRDRRRFIASRGMLRELLGRRLGSAPERIRFRVGPHGKPALVDDELHFSVSHSGELALFAVSPDSELGIDVEQVRPVAQRDRIVDRYFTADEWAACRDESGDRRFFRCWTRKEAWLKARGEGLSGPVDEQPSDDARWTVRPIEAAPGFVAALAEERGDAPRPIDYRQWSDGVDAH